MYLDDNMQNHLRKLNYISQNEVLRKEGDLFVAVNVIDNKRRIVTIDNKLIEIVSGNDRLKKQKLLKG